MLDYEGLGIYRLFSGLKIDLPRANQLLAKK
jgi:hypothetical protein